MSHGQRPQDVVVHLGMLVRLELHDGTTRYGRVEAVDEVNVYLARAVPAWDKETLLSSIKTVCLVTEFDRAPKLNDK